MTGSFDHRDRGTLESAWMARPELTQAPLLQLPGPSSHVVVLAAHPDDETLGAGGLIAAAATAGASVEVIIATDGEASHPGSPTHAPDRLAALRRVEAGQAVACLDPQAVVTFLGWPDGELAQHQSELTQVLEKRLRPGCLLLTPWRADRHPDHQACAFAARALLCRRPDHTHWQYPIWAWHWADPEPDPGPSTAAEANVVSRRLPWSSLGRVDLTDDSRTAKQHALACYRSQHLPLSDQPGDEAILSAPMLAHFDRPFESFIVEPAHAAGSSTHFDDLYSVTDDPWGLTDRFHEHQNGTC